MTVERKALEPATTSILIVLYNCSPSESETVNSIVASQLKFSNTRLCIWNNGPAAVEMMPETQDLLTSNGLEVHYFETLDNFPLSWIYNAFVGKFRSENYVLLDHDSKLSKDYLLHITSKLTDFVAVPLITAKGLCRSPTVQGKFSPGPYKKEDCVFAVGSGVVISNKAVEKISLAYGDVFDRRFALYGVDTSFFIRVHELGMSEKIKLIPGFDHSLSRLENEHANIRTFRKVERGYDLGLMLRYYPDFSYFKLFIKQIFLTLLGKNRMSIFSAMQAFIAGLHKRCSEKFETNFQMVLKNQLPDER